MPSLQEHRYLMITVNHIQISEWRLKRRGKSYGILNGEICICCVHGSCSQVDRSVDFHIEIRNKDVSI